MDAMRPVLSLQYHPDVFFALGVQGCLGLVARLLLDGGAMARVMGVAVFGFWLATALLLMRRPHSPTGGDLAWIRWGFWPMFIAAAWVQYGL